MPTPLIPPLQLLAPPYASLLSLQGGKKQLKEDGRKPGSALIWVLERGATHRGALGATVTLVLRAQPDSPLPSNSVCPAGHAPGGHRRVEGASTAALPPNGQRLAEDQDHRAGASRAHRRKHSGRENRRGASNRSPTSTPHPGDLARSPTRADQLTDLSARMLDIYPPRHW